MYVHIELATECKYTKEGTYETLLQRKENLQVINAEKVYHDKL